METEDVYNKIEKMLYRNTKKSDYYEQRYSGKEADHTFHGGWNLGYWEGRVSVLEEVLDILQDCGLKPVPDFYEMMKNVRTHDE